MTSADIALQAVALAKSYGSVRANRDISFAAHAGRIHAVVGENGAGKSTLMRMLQGVEQPDAGQILLVGNKITFSDPGAALEAGIGMVHQEFMMAPALTLLENLVLGAEPVSFGRGPLARIDWSKAHDEGQELAERIGARIDWQQRTSSAPVHTLQFVEIIRLLRRGCDILILDEPTSVLAPPQVEELFALLRNLRETGTTLIFISHKIGEVMALADEVTVIRRGMTVFHSEVDQTSADEISGHIVQGEMTPVKDRASQTSGDPLLRIADLNVPSVQKSHPLHGISLQLRPGEILGIAGVSGNGQTELMECVAGLRTASAGHVQLGCDDLTTMTPAERRAAGLSYISSDRHHEGLCLEASIAANATAGSHRAPPIQRGLMLSPGALSRVAKQRLKPLDVKFDRSGDPASSLSGGNQQKLVFAREIGTQPRLLLASQPTRGVDLNGIAAIHALICDFRDRGGAVLLVSEEIDELVNLSSRVLVLAEGRIVGESLAPADEIVQIGRMMVQAAAA